MCKNNQKRPKNKNNQKSNFYGDMNQWLCFVEKTASFAAMGMLKLLGHEDNLSSLHFTQKKLNKQILWTWFQKSRNNP